jgi:hypothetical protein
MKCRSPSRDDESVFVVRQHVMHDDLEGAGGELASLSNVLHHLGEPSVFTRDHVPAWDVPYDVVGEDMGEPAIISRRPGFVLSAKKRLVRMHRARTAYAAIGSERLLNTSPNPKASTVGEELRAALTPEEMERFERHLRPLAGAGQGVRRSAFAYLFAVKGE